MRGRILKLLLPLWLTAALGLGQSVPSPGSLYSEQGRLADLGRDLRANQVDDLITIIVADQASALSKGTSQSARKGSVNSGVTAALGVRGPASRLPDLARLSSDQQIQGQGTTSRDSTFNTTLSARVVEVMPNGSLVVEGTKSVVINSENQLVSVRGVVRPADIAPGNLVQSNRLGNLEIRVNGKGFVGDAVRKPFFLYRLLLGILTL